MITVRFLLPIMLTLGLWFAIASFAHASEQSSARVLSSEIPDYPIKAIDLGIEGLVLLKVEVDSTGQASQVQVLNQDSHPLLRSAAIRSVKRWQFEPATQAGKTVASAVTIPVRFQMSVEEAKDSAQSPSFARARQ